MTEPAAGSDLVRLVLKKFDELVDLVSRLDDGPANAVLPVAGSNSPVQLLTHCCGLMRRWSSSVNLGALVPRDREAEFTVTMPVAQVLDLAARTRTAFLDDVRRTDLSAAPAAPPPGRDEFWTASCEGVLLHVLEEICQHLGHAEITRDVVLAASGGGVTQAPPAGPGEGGEMAFLPEQTYTTRIEVPAAEVWHALTSAEATVAWYFGNTVESAWVPGSDLLYRGPDGAVDIECEIAEIEVPVFFRGTFRPVWSEEVSRIPASVVEWRLADHGPVTEVTITHSGVVAGSVVAAETAEGWPHLLAALKEYCESRR